MTDTGSPKAGAESSIKTLQDDLNALPQASNAAAVGRKSAEEAIAPYPKGSVPNGSQKADEQAGTAAAAAAETKTAARTSSTGAAADSSKSGELASTKSGQLASSKSGQLASGKSGELAPAKSGDLAAAKSGELAPAKSGQLAAAKSGELAPAKSGDLAASKSSADAPVLISRKSSDASAAMRKSSDAGAAAAAARTSSDAGAASSEAAAPPASKASATPAPATPGSGSVSRSNSAAAAAAAGPKRTSSSGSKLPPAGSAAAAAGVSAERRPSAASSDDLPDGSAPKVKALREQLSQNGTVLLSGGVAQPVSPEPKGETPQERRLSEHDKVNTTNALALLQSGAFKLVPGKDTVPYEKLITLRLEDGIDVTRKEEYLAAEEFATVFKMARDEFVKLPPWKRLQLKKSTQMF